ncbi:MAG TPA: competence/damage-inducible protein A [Gemmatimonadaceae bacterium]|nr:competence/damage-inducible protein A [Gemmatimonadaceae bacterium]
MKIEVVTIGDELLLGFTVDTNAAHLARELAAIGVGVARRSTVGDSPDAIATAVGEALERSEGVITTGGLGPTADDMTKSAIAELFGREMVLDESIVRWLDDRWAKMGRTGRIPESNFTQAMLPAGAEIIPNAHGSAPGIWLEDDRGRWVAMLPGVPREMRAMLAEQLVPRLLTRLGVNSEGSGGSLSVIVSRTLRTTGIAESALADLLGDLGRSVDGLAPAFLPAVEGVDIRLTSIGMSEADASKRLTGAMVKLRDVIGRYVYAEGGVDLAEVVLEECRARNVRIAVAESCTGGLLGARITAIPGASDVFLGGVLAYDNSVKTEMLGVDESVLSGHGAVSEPVALAMAQGVRARLSSDIGIAITGVAGPSGGTPEKPVGTVWIAIDGTTTRAVGLRLIGDRAEIRQRAAQAALDHLRRQLQSG